MSELKFPRVPFAGERRTREGQAGGGPLAGPLTFEAGSLLGIGKEADGAPSITWALKSAEASRNPLAGGAALSTVLTVVLAPSGAWARVRSGESRPVSPGELASMGLRLRDPTASEGSGLADYDVAGLLESIAAAQEQSAENVVPQDTFGEAVASADVPGLVAPPAQASGLPTYSIGQAAVGVPSKDVAANADDEKRGRPGKVIVLG